MPREARFNVRQDGRYWVFSVPPEYSETGERMRPKFKTRKAAEAAAGAFKKQVRRFGSGSQLLSPSDTEDALAALEIVRRHGTTLATVAADWEKRQGKVRDGVTLHQAVDQWLKWGGGRWAESTLANYSHTADQLRHLPDQSLVNVTAEDIEGAIEGKSYRGHVGNARTFLKWCARRINRVKDSWLDELPELTDADRQRIKPAVPLTPAEAIALVRAAEKIRPDLAMVYVLFLFTGLRKIEAERMTWAAVERDGVRVGAEDAKVIGTRWTPLPAAWAKWAKRYPVDPASPILPANWENWDDYVRAEAGWRIYSRLHGDIDGQPRQRNPKARPFPRNALRKTNASAILALHPGDLNRLKVEFGHAANSDTLQRHYAGVYSPKDARKLFNLAPS